MLFEDLMVLIMLGAGVFLIGIPSYKFIRALLPQRRNPMAEAKERLEHARLEVEAAKLDKQTHDLYEHMYQEALEDEDTPKQEIRVDETK